MVRFVLQRLLSGFLVLLGVVFVVFLLFLFINVDPAKMTLGQRSDIESAEAVREKLGLNKPWYGRMALFLEQLSPVSVEATDATTREELRYFPLLQGNEQALVVKPPYLGRSFQTGRKVSAMLGQAIFNTVLLSLLALAIALLFGLTLGVLAALTQHRWPDRLLVSLSAIGVAVPSYFSAILLSFLLGYVWHHYTGLPMMGSLYDLEGHIRWSNLILPAIALGVRPVAVFTQLTRSAMLDVLSQDYVRTARAKGLSPTVVVIRHALRNALNPIITSVTGWLASLLMGAYFVEVIFNFKGLGYLTIRAIESYDFPVIMGSVLLGAVLFVVLNLVADILYAIFDPKVKMTA